MEIWNASSNDYSFVISFQSPTGPGFFGRLGYVASWRPLDLSRGAIRVLGSPLQSFAEAEDACNTMLTYLEDETDTESPDVWSAQCDNDCPNCGAPYVTPYKSEAAEESHDEYDRIPQRGVPSHVPRWQGHDDNGCC
ncbi:hypothetical protein FBZ96_11623 [Bradyrhizobium stylosanthis]|uniref:Uncharacterized protein n=2 Tax=Bradyrhizobium stylosanthis TaxID=1803665 RepID=A0A560CZE4_9BRAD|nr:hypothetical protein FBZ96_11623 [Bradyrhizobium stylosanthis]